MAGRFEIRNCPATSVDRLAQVLPLLLERRSPNDLGSGFHLRQTCRALREAHDYAFQDACLGSATKFFRLQGLPDVTKTSLDWHPPAPTEIEASILRRLARGFKPKNLSIELPWLEDRTASENRVLVLLHALAGTASISSVSLGEHAPLTMAIVQALAAVSPKLLKLRLMYATSLWDSLGALPRVPDVTEDEVAAAAATVRQLLLMVGPQLRDLALSSSDRYCPALAVVDGLSYCTALTQLQLQCDMTLLPAGEDQLAAEASLLRAVSCLTNLRNLSLYGGARPAEDFAVRKERAAELRDCLSALTALTRLEIGLHRLQHQARQDVCESNEDPALEQLIELYSSQRLAEAAQLIQALDAESSALMSACRGMPQLEELRSPIMVNAADLAALTALTYLRLGSIRLPRQPPPPRGAEVQAHPPTMYDLPPLLHRLVVFAPLSAHVLSALRPAAPPPAAAAASTAAVCPYIHIGGAHFLGDEVQVTVTLVDEDVDGEDCLTNRAIRSLCDTLTAVRDRFKLWRYKGDSERGLRVMYDDNNGTRAAPPPAEAAVNADGTHCGTWLGKVAELRLGNLVLSGFALPPSDMLGLARCMIGLKSLDLCNCRYVVSALPLLTGLRSLNVLRVAGSDWDWPLGMACPHTVQAAFLGLTVASEWDLKYGETPARRGAGASADAAANQEAPQGLPDKASDADCANIDAAAIRKGPPDEMAMPLLGLQIVKVHLSSDTGSWNWLHITLSAVRAQMPASRGVRFELVYEDDDGNDDDDNDA